MTLAKLSRNQSAHLLTRITRLLALTIFLLTSFLPTDWTEHFLPSVKSRAFASGGEKKEEKKVKKKKKRKKTPKVEKPVEDEKERYQETPPKSEEGFGHAQFDSALNSAGGIDAVLLLDSSRSMQRTDPHRLRDQGAKLFLRFLAPGDRIALIQFDREPKVLSPLTPVESETLPQLDQAIEGITNEGNFTDLWSPVSMAVSILGEEGRKDSQKCIILLSDGQMDPSPAFATKEELTSRLLGETVDELKKKGIRIYTIALSEQSDRKLLQSVAQESQGLHWYATQASTIHKNFSDLFLMLKKPQVVILDGSGFEVDSATAEVTFYVSREETEASFSIFDPMGKEYTSLNFPIGIKWYRADMFDVITVANPMPGRWYIKGLTTPEGFATLLSDIKLQVRPLPNNLQVGSRASLIARLTENGQPLTTPNIDEITFFSFKIININSGQITDQGPMNDREEDGDEKANDKIFTAETKISEEGNFKALVSVTTPTFTRQQHLSFNVSRGVISFVHLPPNEFTGETGGLRAVLNSQAAAIKNPSVSLVAKHIESEKLFSISMTDYKLNDTTYNVPLSKLEKGTYQLRLKFDGVDSNKKKISGESELIEHESTGEGSEGPVAQELETVAVEDTTPRNNNLLWGLGSLLISSTCTSLFLFIVHKKTGKISKNKGVKARIEYTIPETLQNTIEEMKQKSASKKRTPTPKEEEIFAFIDDSSVATPPPPSEAPEQEEVAAQEEPQDEQANSGESSTEDDFNQEQNSPNEVSDLEEEEEKSET